MSTTGRSQPPWLGGRLRRAVRRLRARVLPFAHELRLRQREVDAYYRACIRQTQDRHERESLRREHEAAAARTEEELYGLGTARLIRRAAKYDIFPPEKPWGAADQGGDDTWGRETGAPGTWYLRPAARAALQREVEEARRRHDAPDARRLIVRLAGLLAMAVVGAVGVVAWFILLVVP
jgi:nitrate reductase NapE component